MPAPYKIYANHLETPFFVIKLKPRIKMLRLKNFTSHTAKVFYITVIMGATVNFENPSDPFDNIVINNPFV